MMHNKKNPIWLNEERQENKLILTGIVPEDLVYLKDHFAMFPLVPGVVELQWVAENIPRLLGNELFEIESIKKLKFQKFLRPNDTFILTLSWQKEKQRVMFSLTTNNENCASGMMKLQQC